MAWFGLFVEVGLVCLLRLGEVGLVCFLILVVCLNLVTWKLCAWLDGRNTTDQGLQAGWRLHLDYFHFQGMQVVSTQCQDTNTLETLSLSRYTGS